ncbi:14183_t:CDS:2, partial [Acaulospora colombiana]
SGLPQRFEGIRTTIPRRLDVYVIWSALPKGLEWLVHIVRSISGEEATELEVLQDQHPVVTLASTLEVVATLWLSLSQALLSKWNSQCLLPLRLRALLWGIKSWVSYGSHGTIVYEGSLQGRAVAVKRLLQDFVTLASHEVSLLLQADDHPNVIRYYFSMTRDSFLYIALEL